MVAAVNRRTKVNVNYRAVTEHELWSFKSMVLKLGVATPSTLGHQMVVEKKRK